MHGKICDANGFLFRRKVRLREKSLFFDERFFRSDKKPRRGAFTIFSRQKYFSRFVRRFIAMKKNFPKPVIFSLNRKTFYSTTIFLLTVVSLSVLLFSGANDFGAAAQSNEPEMNSAVETKRARADMLGVALDLRSAANLTVFAANGFVNNNSQVTGATADGLRETENGARADLATAFSAINQLPCQSLRSQLSGGAFAPGVYCADSANLSREMTLDARGDANGIFVFRIAGELRADGNLKMTLAGGARAGNVFFVTNDSAQIAEETIFRGSILAKNSVEIGKRATVSGRILSLDGAVTATESSINLATGYVQICKQQQGTGLENRVFRFRVGADVYEVQTGQCSTAIQLPVGLVVIEELLDGRTLPTGTFSGRFRLLDINSPTSGALGSVNIPLRTANVFVNEGDAGSSAIINFVNTFAVTATVVICKRSVAPTGPNTTPPSTIPINDQDVAGFFDFTVDATGSTIYTVAVGQCSGPIQVLAPATPQTGAQTARVRITELSKLGYTLESVSTTPADRLQSLTLDAGISNINDTTGYPNPRGGYATVTAFEGGASNQTLVNFFNRSNPSRIKVCKIAGPGIPVGTRFRFEVRGLAPSGPGNNILPGVNVNRTIDVPAGPAETGGNCLFVEGGYIVGTNVLVTEIGALDQIPSDAGATFSESKTVSKTESLNSAASGDAKISRSHVGGYTEILRTLKTQTATLKSNAAPNVLTPFITENGMISLSIDGVGTNAESGVVQARKPAGATVRRAFLLAASIPDGTTISNTDITINGAPVTFTQTVSNTLVTPPLSGIVNNYLGEVTSLVKPTFDAAPAGRVDFTVAENPEKTASIDGVILAVILNDPTQTVNNTIALLFGAQSPNGDNFNIGLANPINTSAPGFALDMSLGISYGFQGSDQFSTVDVGTNTRPLSRLTSSAGGQDDGAAENGALLTVGGLDDSNANPVDPNATPNDDPRIDDELYSLIPFVNNGDATINVRTANPSNNDNIFFAAFFVGNNTAVVGEGISLTPLSATNPVGTAHTVTAAVQNTNGEPVAGRQVRFRVLTGPNTGANGIIVTNASGRAEFTYTSNGVIGTDTIQACFTNAANQEVCSNIVSKNWVQPTESIVLTPVTATNPVGTSHTVTATLQANAGAPVPNRQVRFRVTSGPNANAAGSANTNASGRAEFTYTSNGTVGTDTIQACFTNNLNQEVCSTPVQKIWVLATLPAPPVSRIRSTCGFAPGATAVQGIAVDPNPNVNTKQVIFPARAGTCEVEYTNFLQRPTLLRICKIAGAGVAVGTPFTFDITIDDGPLFPGLTVSPLTVAAGAASQGGNCAFVQGPYAPTSAEPQVRTFRAGSRVIVTERAASGVRVTAITTATSGANIDLPNGRIALSLAFPGATNEIVFTNELTNPAPTAAPLFDFDGDRVADVSIFRAGAWIWIRSGNGQTQVTPFGLSTDKIVPDDYDGDGKTDIAVYRDGMWFVLQSSNGQFRAVQFGAASDIPSPGDFDGDGKADFAVFRPSNGTWYVLQSRDGFIGAQFGVSEDRPARGDFDGDGRTDFAVFRPSNGTWYILQSRDGFRAVQFGVAADKIVPADYDGDGKTDVAVYRSGMWFILRSRDGFQAVPFGIASDTPVPADYDGDGKTDIAVFRDGTWYILRSSLPPAGQFTTAQLGTAEVLPVPSAYVR
jgi:hypothetical protein